MFMVDGRDVAEFVGFLKFFVPRSAVLLGMFTIIYTILERKTSLHNSVRVLIAGLISYIATLATLTLLGQ